MSVRPVVAGRVLVQLRVPRDVSLRQALANRATDQHCPYCHQRGVHNGIKACENATYREDA